MVKVKAERSTPFKIVDRHKEKFAIELENVLKPFVFLCQVFCTAPPCLNFSQEIFNIEVGYRLTLKQRGISFLHHIWSTTLATSIVLATYYQHVQFDVSMGFLTKTLYIGEYVFAAFSVVLIIFCCNWQRKNYFYFFEQLIQIDMDLFKCGIKPRYDQYRKGILQLMASYGIFFTMVLLVDFFYNKMDPGSFFRSSTVYTIPNIIWVLSITQFSILMQFIREKIESINEILLSIVKEMPYNETNTSRERVLISILTKIENQKIPSDENIMTKIVESLRRTHAKISKLGGKATDCFGILLSVTILAGFVVLNIQFFQLYKTSESLEPYDMFLFFYTLLWIVLYGGKVIKILYAGHSLSDEVCNIQCTYM